MDKFVYKKSAGITALSASMSDFTYKKHAHQEYAIGVTLRGIQHYHLNGSLQLSYQNGIMLFNPEQTHDGMAHDEKGLDYVMLYIDPQLLLEVTGKKDIVRFPTPVLYDVKLEQKIRSLSQAVLGDKNEALCSELLLSLGDSLVQTDLSADYGKDNGLIRKAKDMLNGNLEGVLTLDEISGELGISKYQFIRAFKTATGITPYQYFLNSKIERAKQLIEKTGDIYEAVAGYGFVDLTHMNKHFKSIYGITAFEYMSHINHGA
ncbi:MAG TPA: AraC family transcriptional regulator [Sporosarcina psychrophila]|uniref:AraC family transcriptional regulator n=1 Tax=Sporosarcina psychrophila TaxID=1476 RepID=A0A921KCC3_SPOPS|nr:AraC family transcriptional regulator [Sporosarcina psychrophila]